MVSVQFIREILEWCEKDPILSQLADPSVSYLIGHSRVWPGVVLPTYMGLKDSGVRDEAHACISNIAETFVIMTA